MIKKLYLPLVALLVLAFSSCSKMGELDPAISQLILKYWKLSVARCL